jgi:hypothetical protein
MSSFPKKRKEIFVEKRIRVELDPPSARRSVFSLNPFNVIIRILIPDSGIGTMKQGS